MLVTNLCLFSLRKSQRFQYFGWLKHRGAQYCPEWQESFVCAKETKRTNGLMEQWSVLSCNQSQRISFVF